MAEKTWEELAETSGRIRGLRMAARAARNRAAAINQDESIQYPEDVPQGPVELCDLARWCERTADRLTREAGRG